jgi:hypothetical protein
MTSSIVFLNRNPLFFFLDSDRPFNCLNVSIKILLSYIRKFLRKKIIKLEKIHFIMNKNKSKNQVGKSNSQMLLSISFVLAIHDLFGTELAVIFSFHVGLTDSVMQWMQFFFLLVSVRHFLVTALPDLLL